MPGVSVVFGILIVLDEAIKVPLPYKGSSPMQYEPGTPSTEQSARLCSLNPFYRLSNSTAGQEGFCQDTGTSSARYESLSPPAGSWVSLSPEAPGSQARRILEEPESGAW